MSDELCASCLVTICKFRFPQLDERERDLEGKWRTPAGSLACWCQWWLAHHFFRHEKLSPAGLTLRLCLRLLPPRSCGRMMKIVLPCLCTIPALIIAASQDSLSKLEN